jgi:hypothetical protein
MVTIDETAEYLELFGLDTSHARAFDDASDMLNMVHGLHDSERRARRDEAVRQCGNASVACFESACGKWKLYVHQATYPDQLGKWQLSRVDDRGPYGHCNFDTFEEAIASCVRASENSYFDEENKSYRLIGTSGNRRVA